MELNLYDDYGGDEFWSRQVDLLYEMNMQSDILRPLFENKNLERIKLSFLRIIKAALGNC